MLEPLNRNALNGLMSLEKQYRFAAMKALNNTAFAARDAARAEISRSIAGPIPKTLALPTVMKKATRDDPVAQIGLNYRRFTGAKGYLSPQIDGGKRVTKAFERRLQAAGLMPAGYFAVYAKRSGYLDRFGNLPGTKIRQILSFFAAFKEAGFKGNMSDRTRQNLMMGKRKGMKWGIAYFVSKGERGGRNGIRLAPGIWERNYPNGTAAKSFVKPILLFVPTVSYSARLAYHDVVRKAIDKMLMGEFEKQLASALRTAR